MDPIVGGAIVSGVGSIAGGALSGKAAKEAAKMQLQSNREALAFSREQEATRKANYDRAYAIWDASRQELMRRYGITMPASSAPTLTASGAPSGGSGAMPGGSGVVSTNRPPANTGGVPSGGGATLRDIAQPTARPAGSWNDWNRYGLR